MVEFRLRECVCEEGVMRDVRERSGDGKSMAGGKDLENTSKKGVPREHGWSHG